MRLPFCPYEEKTAQLANENRWRTDPDVFVHIQKCSRCQDVLTAVQVLQQNRIPAAMPACAASPGYLWWKAQLLRQNGALVQITKPVVWAEWLAFWCLLVMGAVAAFHYRGWIGEWLGGLHGVFGSALTPLSEIWMRATAGNSLAAVSLLAGLTVFAFIGGLALLFSDSKK